MKKIAMFFLIGIVVLIPLIVFGWVIKILFNVASSLAHSLEVVSEQRLIIPEWAMAVAIVAFVIGLGVLINLITKGGIFRKLPKTLSGIQIREFIELIFSKDKKVVLIEFPRKGIYSVGIVTRRDSAGFLRIFIPNTPITVTGYLVIVPRDEAIPLKIGLAQALTIYTSGGTMGTNLSELEGLPRKRSAVK